MRMTLRRSCAACAKAKHSCDLRTPKCSRCVKRNCNCIYANEPLTSTTARLGDIGNGFYAPQASKPHTGPILLSREGGNVSPHLSDMSIFFEAHLFDPFDSYPSTNLSRLRVQGLMRHCKWSSTGDFWFVGLTIPSLVQNRISVLSFRSESIFKPLCYIVVAVGSH